MSAHANESWRVTGDTGDWSARHDGTGSSEYQAIKDGDEVVALVVSHTSDLWKCPPDTSPRARLISAAPELLAFAQWVISDRSDSRDLYSKARAAIAKATTEAKP